MLGGLPQSILEHLLELLQHRFLDHDVLLVQVVDDVLVAVLVVYIHDNGLDRRVTFDEDTLSRRGVSTRQGTDRRRRFSPLMARGMMTDYLSKSFYLAC